MTHHPARSPVAPSRGVCGPQAPGALGSAATVVASAARRRHAATHLRVECEDPLGSKDPNLLVRGALMIAAAKLAHSTKACSLDIIGKQFTSTLVVACCAFAARKPARTVNCPLRFSDGDATASTASPANGFSPRERLAIQGKVSARCRLSPAFFSRIRRDDRCGCHRIASPIYAHKSSPRIPWCMPTINSIADRT